MEKSPVVIPIVRVVHACPPIEVCTSLSDFPAVVQKLTGKKNSGITASDCNTIRFPLTKKSTEEGAGSHTFIASANHSTARLDHQITKHINKADSSVATIDPGSPKDNMPQLYESFNSCNTDQCNHDDNICWLPKSFGALQNNDKQARSCAEHHLEGFFKEEDCNKLYMDRYQHLTISDMESFLSPVKYEDTSMGFLDANTCLSPTHSDSECLYGEVNNLLYSFEEPTTQLFPFFL